MNEPPPSPKSLASFWATSCDSELGSYQPPVVSADETRDASVNDARALRTAMAATTRRCRKTNLPQRKNMTIPFVGSKSDSFPS